MGSERKLKFLEPKRGEPKSVNFATFDIEANAWTDFEMVGFYDGRDFYCFEKLEAFFAHVFQKRYRGYKIFGHYAGKYDDNFLLDHAERSGKDFLFSTITQGSKILSLKFKRGRHTWQFVDSSGLFPGMGLDRLTRSFEVAHRKKVGAIDFERERVDRHNRQHVEYLKHDCIGLYEVLEKYFSDPKITEDGFSLTIASQALGVWRRTLKSPIRITPQSVQDFTRKSYVGGRTEIFKMRGEGLNYYDVNSLYPFVMRTMRLPVESNGSTREVESEALGFFDVTVRAPSLYIPILPLKFQGKLLFPTGTFRGVFFSEELKLALEHGYKIEKVHRGHRFTESRDLFSEYIDYFHRVKSEAKKGSASELIAKLLLNSLYGKFGQREERLTLKQYEGERLFLPFHSYEMFEKTGLVQIPKYHRSPHMLAHIASAITSYGRIHMARTAYLKFPEKCFYTDTDSIFTPERLSTGNQIGDLKLEHSDIAGEFKLPKAYYLEKEGKKLEAKIKGFSRNFVEKLGKEEFIAGDFKEEKIVPCTIRTSLIRNGNYLSKIGVTREIRTQYSKRRVLKSGDTEPWIFKNGHIINGEKRK